MVQADIVFSWGIWMGLSLWNGVLSSGIVTWTTFSWAVPLWCKMANIPIFLVVWGCSQCHDEPIWFPRLQNVFKFNMSINGWHWISYVHFMLGIVKYCHVRESNPPARPLATTLFYELTTYLKFLLTLVPRVNPSYLHANYLKRIDSTYHTI